MARPLFPPRVLRNLLMGLDTVERETMKTKLATLLLSTMLLPSCGILNLGSTNEDGTDKLAADARLFLRSFGDAALQTWGSQWLRNHAPDALAVFDVDHDGALSLAEIESQVNLEDPASTTALLIIAIELWQAKKAQAH